MRYIVFAILILSFASCESDNFTADKRQIMAKDQIRYKIGRRARGFDILSFREDTLTSWPDTAFKKPLQYTLDFIYQDSAGILQNKKGMVVFAPDGRSIIGSEITER